jgi:hypothetical protein
LCFGRVDGFSVGNGEDRALIQLPPLGRLSLGAYRLTLDLSRIHAKPNFYS